MAKYQTEYKMRLYSDKDGEIEIGGRNYNFSFLFRDGDNYLPVEERSELELKIINEMKRNALEVCIQAINSNIRLSLPVNEVEVKFECETIKINQENNYSQNHIHQIIG